MEIERKYLIRYPDTAKLRRQPGCRVKEIEQTYLSARPGVERRVRKTVTEEEISYTQTYKSEGGLCRSEDQCDLSERAFLLCLEEREEGTETVRKTRYCIPFGGHILEIDVYPFWQDRAILEIELEDENEPAAIPSYTAVIREVTDDPSYRNHGIAKAIAEQATDRLPL